MTKNELFSIYNQARVAARNGKISLLRINRALGILQSRDGGKAKFTEYHTTTHYCRCMDNSKNPSGICKHRLAKMMELRVREKAPKSFIHEQTTRIDFVILNSHVLVSQFKESVLVGEDLHTVPTVPQATITQAEFDNLDLTGFVVRKWPGGCRAWKGTTLRMVRTRYQMLRMRASLIQTHPELGAYQVDLMYDC